MIYNTCLINVETDTGMSWTTLSHVMLQNHIRKGYRV